MRRRSSDSGSMDMLLDTMCNTFGGVSFIALMVAILSAVLPKASNEQAQESISEAQVIDREAERLRERRDVLRRTIGIYSSFVENAATGLVVKADLARMAAEVAANDEKIRLFGKKRIEYMDELAKVKTLASYSRREAARLTRLLKDLEEKVGRPLFDRHRAVRTPREREVQGLKIVNVWLHERHLYMMDDKRNVREVAVGTEDGKRRWDCELVKGRGVVVDDDFFLHGKIWPQLQKRFDEKTYIRIFTDTVSFDELCLFRDALISRKAMYNWIVNEEDVIHFIEGYDGHVQ